MDSVPPELAVPQCFPSSFLSPMKSAVMAMTYISICLTSGKVSTWRGLAKANCLERLMMNLECCSTAYLDPEHFPLSASFSERSPRSVEGGL